MAKEKVLVIDADSAVYACGFMAESKTHYVLHKGVIVKTDRDKRVINKWVKEQDEFDPDDLEFDLAVDVEPVSKCLHGVKQWVEGIMEYSTCHRYIVLLTKGGTCFRTMLATINRYKGNRMGMKKPEHYDNIRTYLSKYHSAKTYIRWEADDTATMIMSLPPKPDVEYILAAIDKDLDQVPGKRMNPNKRGQKRTDTNGEEYFEEDWGIYVVGEWDIWYSFYKQMLTGDKADNIKGLSGTKGKPGWGEKKAEKALQDCDTPEEMCQVVVDAYRAKYGDEPFEYTPWWWGEEWDDDKKYDEKAREQPLEFRKNHPVYGKVKTLIATWVDMFRENANLLYMLRDKTDQYVPHVEIEGWESYEQGTVIEFLGE